MSNSIRTSPFLTPTIIDQLLRNDSLPPSERIKYLSARLSLLSNPAAPHTSSSSSRDSPQSTTERDTRDKIFEELSTRTQLGLAYMEVTPPELHNAEGELSIVATRTKGLLKARSTPTSRIDPQDRHDSGTVSEQAELKYSTERGWVERVRELRIQALEGLIRVEEGLGRRARAERWKEALHQVQGFRADAAEPS